MPPPATRHRRLPADGAARRWIAPRAGLTKPAQSTQARHCRAALQGLCERGPTHVAPAGPKGPAATCVTVSLGGVARLRGANPGEENRMARKDSAAPRAGSASEQLIAVLGEKQY